MHTEVIPASIVINQNQGEKKKTQEKKKMISCSRSSSSAAAVTAITIMAVAAALSSSTVSAFSPPSMPSSSSSSSIISSSSSLKMVSFADADTAVMNDVGSSMAGGGSGFVDVDERSERNIAQFEDWSTNACGIQRVDGVHLTLTNPNDQYNQDDVSMMTDVDLPAGSPVMAIPANMILTSTNARLELESICAQLGDDDDAGGLKKAVDLLQRLGAGDTIPKFYLFLKILLEYSGGLESPYAPWLDATPRLYYNSVSMTDFCYECLPPLVFQLSRRERVKFDNFYDALQKLDSQIFYNGIGDEIKSSKDSPILKWAFNVVHTRCFSGNRNGNSGNNNGIGDGGTGGEEQKIVIMADMLNHGTETDVELQYDEEGNCNVYTVRDVPGGSPLRISYGCPTNPSEFFATYGFLDESSPATFCKIMNIQPTPELKTIGLDFSRMLFYKDTGDVSPEVWDVILYAKVLAQDLDTKQAFYEAHVNGDGDTKNAIHTEYFGQTSRELKNHVDMFLEQLHTLSSKADDKDWNDHPRLPLILRHNEFVRSTFENVKSRLDPMVEEYEMQQ